MIGIDKYPYLQEEDELDCAIKGNREIRNALKKNFKIDKSISLTNGNATRQKIEDSWKRFYPEGDLPLSEEDRLIVVFSGHGEEDEAGNTFWLPYNARPTNDTFWYRHDKVIDHFKLIEAKHILVLSDSCFSGGLHKTRTVKKRKKPELQTLVDNRSRYIFSSGAKELVEDNNGNGISSFAEAIVHHLNKNEKDYFRFGTVSDEIKKYVRAQTSQKASYREALVSPDNGGELIIEAKRSEKKISPTPKNPIFEKSKPSPGYMTYKELNSIDLGSPSIHTNDSVEPLSVFTEDMNSQTNGANSDGKETLEYDNTRPTADSNKTNWTRVKIALLLLFTTFSFATYHIIKSFRSLGNEKLPAQSESVIEKTAGLPEDLKKSSASDSENNPDQLKTDRKAPANDTKKSTPTEFIGDFLHGKKNGGETLWELNSIHLSGSDYILSGTSLDQTLSRQMWVAKIDQNAKILWENDFGGSFSDTGEDVAITTKGDSIVVGRYFPNGKELFSLEAMAVKVDSNGKKLWGRTVSMDNAYCSSHMIVKSNINGIYDIFGTCNVEGMPKPVSTKGRKIFFLKINENGKIISKRILGNLYEHRHPAGIVSLTDGYLLTGSIRENSWRDFEDTRVWLSKIDFNGNLIWERSIPSDTLSSGINITKLNNGSEFIISASIRKKVSSTVGSQIRLIKVTTNGDVIWDKVVEKDFFTSIESMIDTKDEAIILVGSKSDFKLTNSDGYIAKIDYNGNIQWEETLKLAKHTRISGIVSNGEEQRNYTIIGNLTDTFRESDSQAFMATLSPRGVISLFE